jgi:hypothetical protein
MMPKASRGRMRTETGPHPHGPGMLITAMVLLAVSAMAGAVGLLEQQAAHLQADVFGGSAADQAELMAGTLAWARAWTWTSILAALAGAGALSTSLRQRRPSRNQ